MSIYYHYLNIILLLFQQMGNQQMGGNMGMNQGMQQNMNQQGMVMYLV